VLLTGFARAGRRAECARRIHARLSEPVALASGEASVGVSVGIALYPHDGETSSALLSAADAAMYAAKSDRTQIYCFYRADLHASMTRTRLIAEQLAGRPRGRAVDRVAAEVRPRERSHRGAEALLRWTNRCSARLAGRVRADRGRDRLILDIGGWVLEAACREARSGCESCSIRRRSQSTSRACSSSRATSSASSSTP